MNVLQIRVKPHSDAPDIKIHVNGLTYDGPLLDYLFRAVDLRFKRKTGMDFSTLMNNRMGLLPEVVEWAMKIWGDCFDEYVRADAESVGSPADQSPTPEPSS